MSFFLLQIDQGESLGAHSEEKITPRNSIPFLGSFNGYTLQNDSILKEICPLLNNFALGPPQPPYIYEYVRPKVMIEPKFSRASSFRQAQVIIFVNSEVEAFQMRDIVCAIHLIFAQKEKQEFVR